MPAPAARRATVLVVALLVAAVVLGGCAAPVRVTWKTETEMNTAGFNLYRGLSPDGPFDIKVNDALIPPAADPLTGGEYSYIDRTAQAGVTYYYELQEVEQSGAINKFGPINVTAGGLDWRHGLVLGGLALLVLVLWWRGGRQLQKSRTVSSS